MRTMSLLLSIAFVSPLLGQSIETSIAAGARMSLGGTMQVRLPLPPSSGFSGRPYTFREGDGVTLSGTMRVPIIGAFGLATGASISSVRRFFDAPYVAGAVSCQQCTGLLTSGFVGASVRVQASSRVALDGGVAGELIHLGGEGYAKPLVILSMIEVVSARRVVGASVASLGSTLRLRERGAVRIDLQLRRYRISYRSGNGDIALAADSIRSTPSTDLRLTVGWTPSRSRESPRRQAERLHLPRARR